jgi:hypothetical protein
MESNSFLSILSRLERRLCYYFGEFKIYPELSHAFLPTHVDNKPLKCKDFDMDKIDLNKIQIKVKERKMPLIKPMPCNKASAEYCNNV